MRTTPILLALATAPAFAGPVATQAELETILDDAVLLEDFEGFSVHGGTSYPAPNPLNDQTAPTFWDLLPGVTYESATALTIYGGFLHGDDSNILRGGTHKTLTFDEPQVAVGFELVYNYQNTATFYSGETELGSLEFQVSGFAFAGWHEPTLGITHVVITSDGNAGLDNVGWGIALTPVACPGDADGNNTVDFEDLNLVLENWNSSVDPGTDGDTTGDGTVNFDDLNDVLANWNTSCD